MLIETLIEQIVEEAPEKKKESFKKSTARALAHSKKPLQEKLEAELKYLNKDSKNVGLILALPINAPNRLNRVGRPYQIDSEATIELRFFPLNSNFSQPGFAQRMLNKGAVFMASVNQEAIDAFIAGARKLSPDDEETSGYERNLNAFWFAKEQAEKAAEKDLEIENLRKELEELKALKESQQPKGKA